ncbi:MAG: hypothetical protein MCS20_02005 [Candidatus Phytoplasma mali]|nr:hypothetical protein [Candidatus Phytoplasma australiense]MCG7202164.1 hypothetical protein [Candidatus Phytoplasma mali]
MRKGTRRSLCIVGLQLIFRKKNSNIPNHIYIYIYIYILITHYSSIYNLGK